jgi:hypothetical protein
MYFDTDALPQFLRSAPGIRGDNYDVDQPAQ